LEGVLVFYQQRVFGYEYKWEFEKFWGKNAKPETILLSQKITMLWLRE
jgi:hypothetical protein